MSGGSPPLQQQDARCFGYPQPKQTACCSLHSLLCQSLSCLSAEPTEHKVLCTGTARMWARTSPHILQNSPSSTLYFPSTREHCPGKTLTLGETTADSFSIEVLIFGTWFQGFMQVICMFKSSQERSFADEYLSNYFSVLKHILTTFAPSFAD